MNVFSITEASYPQDEPLTPEQYAQGLRDPYWFAECALGKGGTCPYVPEEVCKWSSFYQWCVKRGIRVEIAVVGESTSIYAYIQEEKQAVEAKMWFG
jgi:hypothetical protein